MRSGVPETGGTTGAFDFRSILIRRQNQTLSQRIDFAGRTSLNRPLSELGAFVQDLQELAADDAGAADDRDVVRVHGIAPGREDGISG